MMHKLSLEELVLKCSSSTPALNAIISGEVKHYSCTAIHSFFSSRCGHVCDYLKGSAIKISMLTI